jgi:hypothetical protein
MRFCHIAVVTLLVSGMSIVTPAMVQAQGSRSGHEVPEYATDVALLGANTLVAGLTAGITAKLRGKEFTEAFWHGSVGGSLSFAGKRIAAERFDGAGFLGRQVAAVGHSAISNAGRGDEPFSMLWFPIGPVHLQHLWADAKTRARLNLLDVATLAYAASRPELTINWRSSISQGAFVFDARNRALVNRDTNFQGIAIGSTILMSGINVPDRSTTLAHETAHVLQHDFILYAWSDPVEDWLIAQLPWRPKALDYVDFGLTSLAIQGVWGIIGGGRGALYRIREVEAEAIQRR